MEEMELEEESIIPNHYSATLSELDRSIVCSVPPGGNWKNIPVTIPSKRLAQIRESFAAGNGSRSTYYGRLSPNMPAYTISTYFNRPGNGCFIHFEQDRLISQREAARLQSFPDDFIFVGSRTDVNKQIGNAVPPLLAFQIASHFGKPSYYVDLFSGAGGLSLGFKWAGWKPIIANEIVSSYAETYRKNIHTSCISGDISEEKISSTLINSVNEFKKSKRTKSIFLLGGPPCQGFSTAGNRRTMNDDRNHLYKSYANILEGMKPEVFVFENVPGLQNMEGGKVFEEIKSTLQSVGYSISVWVLCTENYGIPQRRKRVFIVGTAGRKIPTAPSASITSVRKEKSLFETLPAPPTVREALSDLPLISAGEDGSNLKYLSNPQNDYQRLMRGKIDAEQYVNNLKKMHYDKTQ